MQLDALATTTAPSWCSSIPSINFFCLVEFLDKINLDCFFLMSPEHLSVIGHRRQAYCNFYGRNIYELLVCIYTGYIHTRWTSNVKGGGSSRFRFSRFLTYMLRHAFNFHPKYPYEGLKWLWEWFLAISEIKNFLPFFVLGKFPKPGVWNLKKSGVYKHY